MNKSKRLQPVAEIAQQKADEAASRIAESRQKIKDRKQQLDELVEYREDYTNGLQHKRQAGLNAAQMNDYILFMERLNLAINQQQVSLDSAYSELSANRRAWQEKQQRARALENVVSRHQLSEQQAQSRREQKESDEHAQRIMRTVAN